MGKDLAGGIVFVFVFAIMFLIWKFYTYRYSENFMSPVAKQQMGNAIYQQKDKFDDNNVTLNMLKQTVDGMDAVVYDNMKKLHKNGNFTTKKIIGTLE